MKASMIFRNLSIKNKITTIILFVVVSAITTGFVIIATWNLTHLKADFTSNLVINARLISDYCLVPLIFGDKTQASETLKRLKYIESVEAGQLYDTTGKVFASYPENLTVIPKPDISLKQIFEQRGEYFYISEPVFLKDKLVGMLYLQAHSASLTRQQLNHIFILSAILLILVFLSYLLALNLQRTISKPILNLATFTESISKTHDFSLRFEPPGRDEVGILYRQFNNLLEQLELKQSERDQAVKDVTFLAHVLRNVNEHISITDLNDHIIFVNQSLLSEYGYTENELVGKPVEILRSQDNPPEVIREIYPETLNGGWLGELKNRRKDGSEFMVLLMTSVIYNDNGEAVALVGVSTDITERKKVENELALYRNHLEEMVKQRTAELEQEKEKALAADRLKSAFLATMSHELRTPLNSIIGFTGILMQERPGALNPEQKKQLGMVQGSSRHLLALINDVLDISKIEAGQLKVNPVTFNLSEIIESVTESCQPLAEKKNLQLISSVNPTKIIIESDRQRVQQILINLVNNAIKFTENGSVKIACTIENDFARVSVQDTGIGIEPGKMELLFKPFSQIDTGLSRKHEGSGLGLSICKKLLDILGGTVEVSSEFGKGSIFTVKLPLKK